MKSWWWIYGLFVIQSPSSSFDYDLVIVGAGASGLFASGAAKLFGGRTCLVDLERPGGDCTNAACVPSKSFRSIAQHSNDITKFREYIKDTVTLVRDREILKETSQFEFKVTNRCRFVGRREIELTDANGSRRLRAKKFLICTGAEPMVPENLRKAAWTSRIPLATYRTFLNPDINKEIWNVLEATGPRRIVVVGGGATACELIQSLANTSSNLEILWVAPSILSKEDVILQQAAHDLLINQTTYHMGRLIGFKNKCPVIETANTESRVLDPVDAVLVCIGRSPATNDLDLNSANVKVDDSGRICVRPDLRSVSNPHIYASGDCCITDQRHRSASQAAWTGFHAVRNLKFPFMPFGPSFARNIPRVIYTTPELACVGLTNAECVAKYGIGQFQRQYASEEGMDRADMDRCSRKPGFVVLRADKQGRILGCTAFGPAAAEIANSMGMAIESKLTVYDVARAPHSYPSHGYLLYRIALSMALSSSIGLLDAFGLRWISHFAMFCGRHIRLNRVSSKMRALQFEGTSSTILCDGRFLTFIDLHQNKTTELAAIQQQPDLQRYKLWARKYEECLK